MDHNREKFETLINALWRLKGAAKLPKRKKLEERLRLAKIVYDERRKAQDEVDALRRAAKGIVNTKRGLLD